jgi:nucleoside phosphorylase
MSDPNQYTIGWICATTTSYTAARVFLDEEHHPPYHVSANDRNQYTLGRMSGHNIVIALISDGGYEQAGATAAAKDMIKSFLELRVCLLVGIGGGAPTAVHDVRLGDIVIGSGQTFQFDYGKTMQGQGYWLTEYADHAPRHPAVSVLKCKYDIDGHYIEAKMTAVLDRKPRLRQKYSRPRQESDRLYKPEVVHPQGSGLACEDKCGSRTANLVIRPEKAKGEDGPAVHHGVIASASQLMKDARMRDSIANI